MWLLGLGIAQAWAGCPEPSGTADLAIRIATAEAAFGAMDLDRFFEARDKATEVLGCLGEVVTPVDAADWHRLQALDAFIQRDRERVVSSFVGVLTLLPGYSLPGSIAPEAHPLRSSFEAAREHVAAPPLEMSHPAEGVIFVDGARVLVRPSDRGAVLQMVGFDGGVHWTLHLRSGEEPPEWEPAPPALLVELGLAPAPPVPLRRRLRLPLLATAGAGAVASGTLYGLALSSRSQFDNLSTPYEDLSVLRARTHGLATASVGFAAVAAGATAVVVVPW